jgi:hypothetical protein
MITLKLGSQLTASVLDTDPPRGPATVQSWVDADDLTYRPEPRIRVGSFREADSEGVVDVVLEGGVVDGMRKGLRPRSQIDVGCRRLTP